MTNEQTALSRRAVACKGWRWMPGMNAAGRLDQDGAHLRLHGVGLTGAGDLVELRGGAFDWRQRKDGRWLFLRGGDIIGKPSEVLPDLTDAATLGCLLALVREAWRCVVVTSPDYDEDEEARQGPNVTGWRAVETVRWTMVGEGATEAEALVAALEGAP